MKSAFLFSCISAPVHCCSTSRSSILPVLAAASIVSTACLRSHLHKTSQIGLRPLFIACEHAEMMKLFLNNFDNF